MKIYMNRILKRTEVAVHTEDTLPNGKTYPITHIYAFDEIYDEKYFNTDFQAKTALTEMMVEVCKHHPTENLRFDKVGAYSKLFWPSDIKYDTDRFSLSDGRQIRFMAIQKEIEVA